MNSNLKARLIISQEQSWPSGLLLYLISHECVQCWFSAQNSQLAGQILFGPDVSAGHFQKLFRALYIYIYISVFLISSYGAPLAQRASYVAQHSSLFGPDGAVNYDYIVTSSINSLLIGSRCISNGTHTNHC